MVRSVSGRRHLGDDQGTQEIELREIGAAMTIEQRMADILRLHDPYDYVGGLECKCGHFRDGCGGTAVEGWAEHVAEMIIETLMREWGAAVDDPTAPIPYFHPWESRLDAENDAADLDGGHVVTRFVSPWQMVV
jgi:hypothetical protein